jgi:hypothetical protein
VEPEPFGRSHNDPTFLLFTKKTVPPGKHLVGLLCKSQSRSREVSIEYRRQSTKGYVYDSKLIGRGARDQELDGKRDTRHKIYICSDHQDDVKPYVLCSVGLYCWNMRSYAKPGI